MRSFSAQESAKVELLKNLWGLKEGDRVVEAGCGSGRLTEHIAKAVGCTGRVMAFDISGVMIQKARERRLPAHVSLHVADAASIPASNECFDIAICFHVFPHFANPRQALKELSRVLIPGGKLWINHLACRKAINDFHGKAAPAVQNHRLPDDPTMHTLLGEAGFRVVYLNDAPDGYSLSAIRL